MKKLVIFILAMGFHLFCRCQELFVFSEPASNMPAHSLTTKLGSQWGSNQARITPELMFGWSKKFMLHTGASFSNRFSSSLRWESVYVYGKYRFLSNDDVHQHFRMALFGEAAYNRNPYVYDELTLPGERSGVQIGLIATQLVNKFAVSATVSEIQSLKLSENNYSEKRSAAHQAFNYSFSTGYLVLPRTYKSYNQLNLNLYAELLGQQTWDPKTSFIDLAPALQLIFNSNTKLNLGYRFELDGNQSRSMTNSFIVSLEHTFFNALKK